MRVEPIRLFIVRIIVSKDTKTSDHDLALPNRRLVSKKCFKKYQQELLTYLVPVDPQFLFVCTFLIIRKIYVVKCE